MTAGDATIPDWIAAIGTTGAFVVALALLAKDLRATWEQRREKARNAASKVSAWWEYDTSRAGEPAPDYGRGFKAYYAPFWVLRVRNAGSEPVYECHVSLGPPAKPGDEPAKYFFPIVPPDQTLSDMIHEDEVAIWADDDERVLSKDVWVELTFTDPAGKRWRRSRTGVLEEIGSGGP